MLETGKIKKIKTMFLCFGIIVFCFATNVLAASSNNDFSTDTIDEDKLISIWDFYLSVIEQDTSTCPVDMTHYWKMDEDTPGTYEDYYGANAAYCMTDCPSPSITGVVNTAQQFDGSNDEVNVADDSILDWGANDSFSIEYWIKKESACAGSNVSDNEVIVGRDDGSLHWWTGIACMDGGKPIFVLLDNDTVGDDDAWTAGNTDLTDGAWYHIVAVRDASAGKISIFSSGISRIQTTFVNKLRITNITIRKFSVFSFMQF